jgi:glycine cleavage system regulatory protein
MTTAFVLTVTSVDRPGLVEILSQVIMEHEGNWLESRMSRLAGRFAGILLIHVNEDKSQDLIQALKALKSQGLEITLENADKDFARDYRTLELDLIGQDHPGIVHDISHALGSQGISVEELTTECLSGPMSGENLFRATACLRVPRDISTEELQSSLEQLADELMVDIELADSSTA